MKLLTQELRKKLPELGSTEGTPTAEKKAVVKFFNPAGVGTWYGIEFDGVDLFFGYVELFEKEWGYFSLSELESVKTPFGLGIERDLHWDSNNPVPQ